MRLFKRQIGGCFFIFEKGGMYDAINEVSNTRWDFSYRF